jgi:hypothetical protein
MLEITIDGLNAQQRVLADMIWACKTRSQITALVAGLPTKKMKQEAEAVVEMMIMATVEQCYDGLGTMDEAQALIRKVSK